MAITMQLASLAEELGAVTADPSWTETDVLASAVEAGLLVDDRFCARRVVLPDGRLWDSHATVENLGLASGAVLQVVRTNLFIGSWVASNFPGTWGCVGYFCKLQLDLAGDESFELSVTGIFHDWENEANRHARGLFNGSWKATPHGVILSNVCQSGDGICSLNADGIKEDTSGRSQLWLNNIELPELFTEVVDQATDAWARSEPPPSLALPLHSSSPLELRFHHTAGWTKEAMVLARGNEAGAVAAHAPDVKASGDNAQQEAPAQALLVQPENVPQKRKACVCTLS